MWCDSLAILQRLDFFYYIKGLKVSYDMKLLSFFPPNVQVKTEINNICIVLMDQRINFFPASQF